jgi:hypothetical protein
MPLPSPLFGLFFSRSRQKISKNFFPPASPAILTAAYDRRKKARQLAFSPYPRQKRSIKKQNQEAMFRNETRSSGHSFFRPLSQNHHIARHAPPSDDTPTR